MLHSVGLAEQHINKALIFDTAQIARLSSTHSPQRVRFSLFVFFKFHYFRFYCIIYFAIFPYESKGIDFFISCRAHAHVRLFFHFSSLSLFAI